MVRRRASSSEDRSFSAMCSTSSSKRIDCVSQASAAASSDGLKNPPRNNRAKVSGSMALSTVTSGRASPAHV